MWVGLPAEHDLKEMSGVMREPIHAGVFGLQPARQQIDCQREAIHLGEQGDQKRTECTEGAPVALRLRLEEGKREEDEDRRVDDNEPPQSVSRHVVVGHCLSPA
jgi:hypothetical protein